MGIYTEELTKIIISEIAGTGCCVAACDGHEVYNRIVTALADNKKVVLSFAEISDITPAFLNSAIGQLYGTFSAEFIESNLIFTDIPKEDEIILKRVIERAIAYSQYAPSCRKALRNVLGGEDA
jgi:hypothetical protein